MASVSILIVIGVICAFSLADVATVPIYTLDGPVMSRLKHHFAALEAIATEKCPENLLYNLTTRRSCLEGHIYDQQARYYFRIGANPLVATICEVGFNAGHSAAVWLTANPSAVLHSFDLGHKYYTDAAEEYIQKEFGGRLILYRGDSTKTVPEVLAKSGLVCDIVHVDGGHTGDIPRLDMMNFLPASHCHTVLLVDDVPTAECIMNPWNTLVTQKVIAEHYCAGHLIFQPYASTGVVKRGWCAGEYAGRPCPNNPIRMLAAGVGRGLDGHLDIVQQLFNIRIQEKLNAGVMENLTYDEQVEILASFTRYT